MENKTTISISKELVKILTEKKAHPKETYEEVIRKLLGGLA